MDAPSPPPPPAWGRVPPSSPSAAATATSTDSDARSRLDCAARSSMRPPPLPGRWYSGGTSVWCMPRPSWSAVKAVTRGSTSERVMRPICAQKGGAG